MFVLLAVLSFASVVRIARRRRTLVTVLPPQAISTIRLEMTMRQAAKKRAALDAATAALR